MTMFATRTIPALSRAVRDIAGTFDLSELSLCGLNMWAVFRLCLVNEHDLLCNSISPMRALPSRVDDASGSPELPASRHDMQGVILEGVAQPGLRDVLSVEIGRDLAGLRHSQAKRSPFEAAIAEGAQCGGLSHGHCILSDVFSAANAHSEGRWLMTPAAARHPPPAAEFLRFQAQVARLCDRFNRSIGAEMAKPAQICPSALRLLELVPAWEAVLRRIDPGIVVVNNAFCIEKMALCAAARRTGHQVAEHTHLHGSHADLFLSALPPETLGLDVIPHVLWVWSDWFARCYAEEQISIPRIVGSQLLSGTGAVARRNNKGENGKKRVLYCQQGLLSAYDPSPVAALPATMIALMQAADDTMDLDIRLHPKWAGYAEETETALRSLGMRNANVRGATEATLAKCLDEADVVLTGFSTTACDAHDIGIPVVLNHPIALDVFGRAIDAGMMRYAEGVPDTLAALRAAEATEPKTKLVLRDKDLAAKALKTLAEMRTPRQHNRAES
jgi:hypothetical protein